MSTEDTEKEVLIKKYVTRGTLNEYEIYFLGDENVLELNRDGGCEILWMYWIVHFKMANFVMWLLPQFF